MAEENIMTWLGRTQDVRQKLDPGPAQSLAAILDLDPNTCAVEGTPLPPLWNWAYFLARAPTRQIGPDGHPARGGFLPPIDLARRMWAGSRCRFHRPLMIGATAQKTSTITDIREKQGRAGPMVFVTVHHTITTDLGLAYEEDQDIVYMDIPKAFAVPEAVRLSEPDWSHPVVLDPVLLFRFSAVTFNSHRIHYDRDYAKSVENYPGLVVHGPLQAILGFHYACQEQPDRQPQAYRFKGVRPLFDFDGAQVAGRRIGQEATDIFTATADGAITMEAQMTWD